MKLRHTSGLLFSLLILLNVSACSDNNTSSIPSESLETVMDDSTVEHIEKHLDPKYVCPMHPQIIKDQEGSCPI